MYIKLRYFHVPNWPFLPCRNVDSITFAEFCEKLTDKLRKEEENKFGKSDTLPMKSLLTVDDEKDNLNKTSIGSKDDKLLLPPREEDDPDRLGFDGNYLKPKIESDIWQQFEDDERMKNMKPMQANPPPQDDESHSRNSLGLFQDALSISPPPEEIDLTDAIKTVLNKHDWSGVSFCIFIYISIIIWCLKQSVLLLSTFLTPN